MQISNVISGLTDPTSWGKKSDASAQAGSGALKILEPQAQANTTAQKASADILRQYDVTKMSPIQFTQMVQKLYQAGAISEKEYQELSAIRGELDRAGVDPNESINMLELFSDKVNSGQKEMDLAIGDPARQQQLGIDMRRLDWMQKFAMIQANPDAVGLDMAA